MAKIFISHSSSDKEIIDLFKNKILNGGLGIADDDIAYTSAVETGAGIGDNIPRYIKDNIARCDFVFFMISERYRKSEICLNEMGAAWALDKRVIPLLIEDIDSNRVGWLYSLNLVAKINDSEQLDCLRDKLINCSTTTMATSVWNRYKTEFLGSIGDGSGMLPRPKSSVDVDILFNNEAESLTIYPQFTIFHKPTRQSYSSPSTIDRSKDGLSAIEMAMNSISQTVTPIISCNVDRNTYKELSWSRILVDIHNPSTTLINDYHIDFKFFSDADFELDDNYGHKSIISNSLINNVLIKSKNGITTSKNSIEFRPTRARLVGDESNSFAFHIKTGQEECEIDIKWILKSENFKKKGVVKLISKPIFEDKEDGYPIDINYINPEDCTIEPKKIIKE